MNNKEKYFITKYATFDPEKVKLDKNFLKFLKKKKKIAELKAFLWEKQEWQIYEDIDKNEEIKRSTLLECMVANFCVSINLKYFYGSNIPEIIHINFRNLKQLTFSVDSDAGYMSSVQLMPNIDAPNLVKLDISNMEEGGFSLRPLRKCFFPRLQVLDLSYHSNGFKDFNSLSQAYFPSLRELNLEQCNSNVYIQTGNMWKAKMESLSMRKQLEFELSQAKDQQNDDPPRKQVKPI